MATIKICNLPDGLVNRIKRVAKAKGISMDQELRDLLQSRYVNRAKVLERIRQRNESLPTQSAADLETWLTQ